ncbi:hypothetical protein L208DRAFT_1393838 [Tricholoma matsutake]|nr:hypothetical protein L208DRAFT_1393838 [Tricholoma matsutake 945]
MSFVGAILVLALVWAVIHAIQRSNLLLPSAYNHFRRNRFLDTSTTQVFLNLFHLRLQTTAWNIYHDNLATELKRQRSCMLSKALMTFYDLGSVFGILGMLIGLILLSWTCGLSSLSLATKISNYSNTIPRSVTTGLARRSLEGAAASLPKYESFIKPIIPGLTVPLAHLPIILIAVFFTQIVHEFGHAIAAALESVPLLFSGASFTLLIPSAFVTISATALTELTSRRRLRIIAAGPFHNILLWCMLLTVQQTGLGSVLWAVGYRDLAAIGNIVVRVDPNSPLHPYLPPATIITKLDDTFLGLRNSSADMWTSYLTGAGDKREKDMGWCVEVLAHPESCCADEKTLGLSCFTSTDDPSHRGCMDPIPILAGNGSRCWFAADCFGVSTCVRPDKTGQLLRLTVHRPSNFPNQEDVVLWSGPLREVWEQVDIGTLMPRLHILPLWMPTQGQVVWEYLIMATLSLYIFNLLPLPWLDGSHFLRTILQMKWSLNNDITTNEYDLEALEFPREQWTRFRGDWWRDQLANIVQKVTIGLFGGCIVLETMKAIF